MINLGYQHPGSTLYIPFESFAGATGAPITMSGFALADIKVYKDASMTERASTSGFALLDTDGTDLDGITGIHGFSIDLSDDTTADFWKNGSKYTIVISSVTVDGQAMNFIAAVFRIGYEQAIFNTFVATLSSQTSFTLNSGPAEDNALKGMQFIVHNKASGVQRAIVVCSAYTGSTKTVTLAAGATFTLAAGDNVSPLFLAPLQPTTPGRTVGIDASGRVDLGLWLGSAPNALTSGRVEVLVGAVTAGVIAAASFAANALDAVWSTVTRTITGGTIGTYTGNTPQTGDAYARLGAPAGASVSVDIAAVKTDTGNLVTRIPSTLFSGITSLKEWLGALAGKQVANSTARTEIRSSGAGSGTFDETTDSQEALRDRGDAAWITATGFATPTNITAGTITTVTNLTNAPPDSSGVTTLLARIGAFTGTGVNTVLGFFKALLSSAASTPSDVGGTFSAATDSTEAIRDRGDAAWTTGSAAPTVTQIRQEMDSNSTQLAKLGTPAGASLAADIAGVPVALLDLANGVETGLTLRQAMRLIAAAEAGQISGAATTTIVIKAAGVPGTTRITATVDADGNRSSLTLNP